MGKQSGKSPVAQTIYETAIDKLPKSMGDKIAQGWSEKHIAKRAMTEDNKTVSELVMQKAVMKSKDGEEITQRNVLQNTPYLFASSESGKNIGWFMLKGQAAVGRIYEPKDYELLKNDPDRPNEFADCEFDTMDPSEFGLDMPDDYDENNMSERQGVDLDDIDTEDDSDYNY